MTTPPIPWKPHDVPDIPYSDKIRQQSVESHTKAAMRTTSEPSKIGVPLQRAEVFVGQEIGIPCCGGYVVRIVTGRGVVGYGTR
jgi:hypothetical protein